MAGRDIKGEVGTGVEVEIVGLKYNLCGYYTTILYVLNNINDELSTNIVEYFLKIVKYFHNSRYL